MPKNVQASEDMALTVPGASPTAYNHPLLQARPAEAKQACKCGKLRPPRKLHSAIGLWLALFVGAHFFICMTGLNPQSYEHTVGLVHRSLAYLPGAVLLLILLPMLLQAGSGLYLLAKEGVQYNVKRCDRGGKLRYFMQRWSGLAMLTFLVPHVAAMRDWGHRWSAAHPLSPTATGAPDGTAFAYTASAFHPWNTPAVNSITILLLLVGVIGTVFHIANGAWSGAILWKLIESPKSKALMGYLCVGFGVALAAIGTVAWYAFALSSNVHLAAAATGR